MATMRMMGLMVLMLSGGLISWAGAQPMAVDPPRLQEPPLLSSPPRQGIAPGRAMPSVGSEGGSMMEGEPQGWTPRGGLQVREDRGIRYVSGGIGISEREELDALSHQFNLRLLFAVQTGNYLADVRVNISDTRGETVFSAKSEGPWFLVQLPPGAYTVDVDALGRTQGQSVRINSGRQSRLNFFWR